MTIKAKVTIEDSKGATTYEKNFKSNKHLEQFRQSLRRRVETGATFTVTPN